MEAVVVRDAIYPERYLKIAVDGSITAGVGGGGGGVQYTEGDVDSTITGNALMWEDAANVVVVASATKPLPVGFTTAPSDPFGTTADAVVAAGAAGSQNAHLRAISRDIVANIVLAGGNNNIGDVDLASVPSPLSTAGAGTAAAAHRTTLASDDPLVAATGATADAVVAAGAVGSVSAKLRRATQGLEDLKTGIVLQTGANVIGALSANQSVNNAQIGGVAPSMNTGVVGVGVQRISLATDDAEVTGIGGTADATVAAGATGSINAKLRRLTQGVEDLKTLIVLGAGSALIGKTTRSYATATITVATGASTVSSTFDNSAGRPIVGLAFVAGWVTTNITFKVSVDNSTFYDLYDDTMAQVTIVATSASKAISNAGLLEKLAAWPYFQVVSITTQGSTHSIVVSTAS